MLTRRYRAVVSPSLVLNEPSARMGLQSPSVGSAAAAPDNHFRPVSPSLYIPELMPSPTASPCASPSLGLIPEEAMRRAAEMQAQQNSQPRTDRGGRAAKGTTRMTTAVCKRASRMARPSEPSEAALLEIERVVNATEHAMKLAGLEKLTLDEISVFKHAAPSTGKGPAVRAGTGDAQGDAAAQAMMNHVRCFGLLFTLTALLTPVPTCAPVCADGEHQESPRGHQQPGALVAHGRAQCVSAHVRPAGGQRDQEVRTSHPALRSKCPT